MGKVLPLLGLRAFVETGRHGNIKNAAQAMGVSAGAVSQQLKLLQERVGSELFVRTRQGLQLSEAGTQVYPALLSAFDQIEASLRKMETHHLRQTLTINTLPAFAASWLVPRLGRFTEMNPAIEVRIEASSTVVDLRRDKVDIALRHGLGSYPGLEATYLMAPALIPVAAPELLAKGPAINEASDCLAYPLLQDCDRSDWRLWLRALGAADDPASERGQAFDDDFLLIRAAQCGQGIALVRDIYAQEEIASGRLALAIDRPWPTAFAYYAVTLPGAGERQAVSRFIDWLQIEAREET